MTGGRFKKMKPPRMDRSLFKGDSVSILYVLRISYDANGKIISIAPEEGAPRVPLVAWRNMESAAKQ